MTIKTSEGTITASKDMLNLICIAMGEAYKVIGLSSFTTISDEIYDALKESNYYNQP